MIMLCVLLYHSGTSVHLNEEGGGLYIDIIETLGRAMVIVSKWSSELWVWTSWIFRVGLLKMAEPYCQCRISAISLIPGMIG